MSKGAIRSKVRPAWAVDILNLGSLREADENEILATGRDPYQALYDSYAASLPHVFTIFVDGKPAGIFGVAQGPLEGFGIPWMLGNEALVTIPRELITEGREWVDYLNRLYPHLENYVDERNRTSIRWLKAMGFKFPGESFLMPSGYVFRRFTRDV